MIYSEPQKKLLEFIANANNECIPSTIVRKIMEITHLCVIEFIEEKKQVAFHTSITGESMLAQNFIQCLVILDKLEKDNLIFVEKGNSDSIPKSYIGITKDIQLKSKLKRKIESEPEKHIYSLCEKFYDPVLPRPIHSCGRRQTNSYELIQKYADSFIYPTPELIEFVEKGFKTPEQVRFETQLGTDGIQHKKEIGWTKATLAIAIIIPLLTCVIDKCTDSNLPLLNKGIKIELMDTVKNCVAPTVFMDKYTGK